MKRKCTKILLAVLCLATLLTGCSKKEEEPKYADETFVKDMAKGLQERWDLAAKDEKKEGYENLTGDSKEYQQMMISYVDKELDTIEKYTEEKFEDKKLQEIAIKYINLLKEHKELCSLMTVDYIKYDESYAPIYNERSKVIETMVKDYGMTVDEKHQDSLEDFLTNSKMVAEKEKVEEEIRKMVSDVQFKVIEDMGGGYKTYQAVVENTTSVDFKSFQVSINLLNADGVIVETTYDQVSAFKQGAKVQFEFSTDKDFTSTEVITDWWE